MGVELHITRAAAWCENDDCQITSEEWLEYVQNDPELEIRSENGEFHVVWSGKSEYDEPWLNWFQGNIYTKWPDTALYNKMLSVALTLGAKVQDDNCANYPEEAQWEFNPNDKRKSTLIVKSKKKWWQFRA